MHRKFLRREANGKKRAPVSTDADKSSRPPDFENGIKHKLFMAAFVIILAVAMLGWFFALTWGITKLIGFF